MSLERLTLRNFQAHEKIVIDFNPGITTIVGPSDVGKSAIIRALSWVLYNQPSGEAFIKHGEERVQARLRLDGDQLIVRERGKENLYRLDEQEFKAFGSNVPTPIKDLLQVSEINIQRQFDAPFWFAESSGEVSRRLNEIVNLGVIDDALASVAAQLRKANERVEFTKERVAELEQKVVSLAFVGAFSAQVSLCTDLHKKVLETQEKKVRLMILRNQAVSYRKITKEIAEFKWAAHNSLIHGQCFDSIGFKVESLFQLVTTAFLQKKQAAFRSPDLSKAEKAMSLAGSIQTDKSLLKGLIERALKSRVEITQLRIEINEAHDNLHSQFKFCPLCQSPLH